MMKEKNYTDLAVNLLKAVACCGTIGLSCLDCPRFDGNECKGYTDEEVIEAVRFLNKEADNEETYR